MIKDKKSIAELREVERTCIHDSDFLLGVSEQLVLFWKEFYGYSKNNYVIIPCAVNASVIDTTSADTFHIPFLDAPDRFIIGVYSGSAAGWQSPEFFSAMVSRLFECYPSFRLILLSTDQEGWKSLKDRFPDKIYLTAVKPREVPGILKQCDYGFLFREPSVTNKVASPVKFPEYIAAGLKVLISPAIGDFSDFVANNNCGAVISDVNAPLPEITKVSAEEKSRIRKLAAEKFTKRAFTAHYRLILDL